MDSKSKEIKCLRKVGRPYWKGPYWHMNKSAGLIAFIDADNSSPEDIWIMNLDGSNLRKLTHMNPQVKHFAFGEQETVSWKNPEGMTVAGVDILVERGIADPDRLGIGGWSYGGYMSAWAVIQTSRFKAAVMGAGISNLKSFYGTFSMPRWIKMYFKGNPYVRDDIYEKNSPINFIQNAKTPTLIIHGERDTTPPVSQSYEFYYKLREMGVENRVCPVSPRGT